MQSMDSSLDEEKITEAGEELDETEPEEPLKEMGVQATQAFPDNFVGVWLQKCSDFATSDEGKKYINEMFAKVKNLQGVKQSEENLVFQVDAKEELTSLFHLLENGNSLKKVQEIDASLEAENMIWRARETRFELDPLLKRRALESLDEVFLRVLVVALQNELTWHRDALKQANLIDQNNALEEFIVPNEELKINLDSLEKIGAIESINQTFSTRNHIEFDKKRNCTPMDFTSCKLPEIELVMEENALLKAQLDRSKDLMRFLGRDNGIETIDFIDLQSAMENLRMGSAGTSESDDVESALNTEHLIKYIYSVQKSLSQREKTILMLLDIEKKMYTTQRNMHVQNIQLGSLVVLLIEKLDPYLSRKIRSQQAKREEFLTFRRNFLDSANEGKTSEKIKRQKERTASNANDLENIELKSPRSSYSNEEIDKYETQLFEMWGRKFAPPIWMGRLEKAFDQFSKICESKRGFVALNDAKRQVIGSDELLEFCRSVALVPSVLDETDVLVQINTLGSIDISVGKLNEGMCIGSEEFTHLLLRISILCALEPSEHISPSELAPKLSCLYQYIKDNDSLGIIGELDQGEIVRPSQESPRGTPSANGKNNDVRPSSPTTRKANHTKASSPRKSCTKVRSSFDYHNLNRPPIEPRKNERDISYSPMLPHSDEKGIHDHEKCSPVLVSHKNGSSSNFLLALPRKYSAFNTDSSSTSNSTELIRRSTITEDSNRNLPPEYCSPPKLRKKKLSYSIQSDPNSNNEPISPRVIKSVSSRQLSHLKHERAAEVSSKYFAEYTEFLNIVFTFYAKLDPPTSSNRATFDQIAESQRNLSHGTLIRFFREYEVIPTLVDKGSINDIIVTSPRAIGFEEFCLRLAMVSQRVSGTAKEHNSKFNMQLSIVLEAYDNAKDFPSNEFVNVDTFLHHLHQTTNRQEKIQQVLRDTMTSSLEKWDTERLFKNQLIQLFSKCSMSFTAAQRKAERKRSSVTEHTTLIRHSVSTQQCNFVPDEESIRHFMTFIMNRTMGNIDKRYTKMQSFASHKHLGDYSTVES